MKYKEDPVVEEVQRVRKEIFKKCDYDTSKLYDFIKNESRKNKVKSRKRSLVHAV